MESNRDNIIFSLIPESVSFIRDSIIRFLDFLFYSVLWEKIFIVAVLESWWWWWWIDAMEERANKLAS